MKGVSGADWVGLLSGSTDSGEGPPLPPPTPLPPPGGGRGIGVVGKNCGGGGVTNRETLRVVAAVDIGVVETTGWISLAVLVVTVVVLRNVFLLL